MPSKPKTLNDLFLHQLRDVHFADRHSAKLFGKLAKAAVYEHLKEAFETFSHKTHEQVERLNAIFERLDKKPHSVPCEAMQGIVEETKEFMDEFEDSEALDVGLVAAGLAMTHYGVARYGVLRLWSMRLGLDEITPLVSTAYEEKRRMTEALDDLASTVALAAIGGGEGLLTPKMAALTGLA